jgi:hypothetical protein
MANIGGREPYLPVKVTWNLSWITRMWKILLYEVPRRKYSRNKPSKLGEIGNSGAISTYFTKRSEVYFYPISIVSRT